MNKQICYIAMKSSSSQKWENDFYEDDHRLHRQWRKLRWKMLNEICHWSMLYNIFPIITGSTAVCR